MSVSDPLRALVERTLDGDERAFSILVRATQADVWRLCDLLGSPADPDDLTQETFLRVYKALPKFRGESAVRTWILSIARRVCVDHVRSHIRHRRLVQRIIQLAPPAETTPTHDRSTADLLTGLEENRREAFVLTQYLGLTYEETAELLDCAIGTIRSRVARARADLMNAWRESSTG